MSPEWFNQLSEKGSGGVKTGLCILYIQFTFQFSVAAVSVAPPGRQQSNRLFLPPTALGAAYGTAKSGTGIAAMSVMRPELIMKSIIPVVMAGIIAIYGLVVAVLIANNISERVPLYK